MVEVVGHEPGVFDADAEAEGAHRRRVGVVGDFLHHQASPRVGTRVGVAQCVDVVAASAAPWDLAQVEAVVNPEVEEGRQVLLIDGLPESQFGGDAVVEPLEDRDAVAALRCGGQTEQFDGLEVIEDAAVGRCGRVVKLIDDHDIEVIRRQRVEIAGMQALDRCEHVVGISWSPPPARARP